MLLKQMKTYRNAFKTNEDALQCYQNQWRHIAVPFN